MTVEENDRVEDIYSSLVHRIQMDVQFGHESRICDVAELIMFMHGEIKNLREALDAERSIIRDLQDRLDELHNRFPKHGLSMSLTSSETLDDSESIWFRKDDIHSLPDLEEWRKGNECPVKDDDEEPEELY